MSFNPERKGFAFESAGQGATNSWLTPPALVAYGENNVQALRTAYIAGALVRPEVLVGDKVSRL
jgi:hypothetical protein